MSRNSILDRRALFLSAVAASLLAASGVSGASPPRRGGRLRMALSGASRSDTWVTGDGLFMQVARQGLVFDTLTEIAADGTLRGELATDWSASPDARIWDFKLRDGITFHDGMALTAKDVVASLRPLLDGQIMATGTRTLRIVLRVPDVGLPLRLARHTFIIRAAHAPKAGIGTGLYRIRHFAAGQQLVAERVSTHYKGNRAGWFDEVELVSIPAESVRAQALGEYLVDAADLQNADELVGLPYVTVLPDTKNMIQAVSRDLAQPDTIGFQRPMDNLRAAERWWFA